MPKVVLIGGGGHCRIVIDNLRRHGTEMVGILDDEPSMTAKDVMGVNVIGRISALPMYRDRVDYAVIGVTDPRTRQLIDKRCTETGVETVGFVHPDAVISPTARVSSKAQVCAGAIVNPEAEVRDHAIVNTGGIVEHECVVGRYAHIAPGVRLLGRVEIGDLCLIGAAATVLQNLRVGSRSIVGAGALVLTDVEEDAKYMGLPAKKVGGKVGG
jgi:UDP-perosamine 4-acetyltransferase